MESQRKTRGTRHLGLGTLRVLKVDFRIGNEIDMIVRILPISGEQLQWKILCLHVCVYNDIHMCKYIIYTYTYIYIYVHVDVGTYVRIY